MSASLKLRKAAIAVCQSRREKHYKALQRLVDAKTLKRVERWCLTSDRGDRATPFLAAVNAASSHVHAAECRAKMVPGYACCIALLGPHLGPLFAILCVQRGKFPGVELQRLLECTVNGGVHPSRATRA